MKRLVFLLLPALLLAGCDALTSQMVSLANEHEPAVVIEPSYYVMIDNKRTPIFGVDKCPRHDWMTAWLFGPAPNEGENLCIRIDKTREQVVVQFPRDAQIVTESWRVERREGKYGSQILLRRPDGSMVFPA